MGRAKKRKIVIEEQVYFWVLDGNTINGRKETHIRVHSENLTKSILYIDPYNWHFEIGPQTIEKAIRFAISVGWNPNEKGLEMYIGMKNEGEFYMLAEGIKFGYKEERNIV